MTFSLAPRGDNAVLHARYSNFFIAGGEEAYTMTYSNFTGTARHDALKSSRGRRFSTKDRDADTFPLNCAQLFGGGGWFSSCGDAMIFGPLARTSGNGTTGGMKVACWRGLRGGRRDGACTPLTSVTMTLRRAADGQSQRRLVHKIVAPCNRLNCKSQMRQIDVSETGLYTITAAGGAGGPDWHTTHTSLRRPGGRGAVVKSQIVLRAGTKLGVVVGCGGRPSINCKKHCGGRGGNATIVADRSRGVLLVMAGGGGGARQGLRGQPGRAVESAGRSWWSRCDEGRAHSRTLEQQDLFSRGNGWAAVRDRVLSSSTAGEVQTGETHDGWYMGDCGGGFSQCRTPRSDSSHAVGGGGGSFCNSTAAISCSAEEGGNGLEMGFLLIEKHSCF